MQQEAKAITLPLLFWRLSFPYNYNEIQVSLHSSRWGKFAHMLFIFLQKIQKVKIYGLGFKDFFILENIGNYNG